MLSIIIPTRNRAGLLLRTLESVAVGVNAGDPVEVIVVDNGSTDTTTHVCRAIRERFPQHAWRYCYDAMPGLLTGRHRGAREAKGDIFCYLDDDVLLSPTWMGAIKEAFNDPNTALAGGPCRPLYEATPPHWLEDLWEDIDGGKILVSLSLFDYGRSIKSLEPYFLLGLNFAIRKDVFHKCGGFHPDGVPPYLLRYRGDGELGLTANIKNKELQAVYHPDAAVAHIIPASRLMLNAFERRAFVEGISDSYTRIRRKGAVARPNVLKDGLRTIRANLVSLRRAAGVHRLMARAHAEGAKFHQQAVRHDAKLLEWILKPHYFDYSLPRGWENHVEEPESFDKTNEGSRNL
jgi:glucosyl-dolichyl phosphate glucuronosyltransferase